MERLITGHEVAVVRELAAAFVSASGASAPAMSPQAAADLYERCLVLAAHAFVETRERLSSGGQGCALSAEHGLTLTGRSPDALWKLASNK